MIANERQYRITKNSAAKFKTALDEFDELAALESGLDPIIVKAQRELLEGQYEDLLQQLHEYEVLKSGESRRFTCDSLSKIGDALVRARIAQGLSQLDLAKRLSLKQQQIQRYEAERYITANLDRLSEIASALGLNVSVELEIKDGDDAQGRIAPNLKSVNIDVKKLPLKEMKKRRWFEDINIPETPETISDEMLASAFLSRSIGHAPKIALFRQKVRAEGKVDMHALFAWQAYILLRARHLIENRALKNVDIGGHWISHLPQLSTYKDGPRRAIDFLWSKGIVVVIEPHLTHTYLDGAAMLLDNKIPVVALTLRHDRLDNFWFVLLHELGHVFRHRNSGLEFGFFDDESALDKDRREAEADEFAEKALISEEAWKSSFVRYANTAQEVVSFAKKSHISASIVAGRIRKERKNFKIFSELVGQGEVSKLFGHHGSQGA